MQLVYDGEIVKRGMAPHGALCGLQIDEVRMNARDIQALLTAQPEHLNGMLNNLMCKFAPTVNMKYL